MFRIRIPRTNQELNLDFDPLDNEDQFVAAIATLGALSPDEPLEIHTTVGDIFGEETSSQGAL